MKIFLAVLMLGATLFAADGPTATMTLTPEELAAGQSAILQIDVSGAFHLASAPVLPLTNLEVVAGPSLENRFEWINGRSSSRTVLVYRVRAVKAGRAGVGPVRLLDASGRVVTTLPLSILVGRASQDNETAPPETMDDPALVARLEPASPYVGQQAVWTLYLVTRGQATQGEVESLPDFRGFWAEDLERETNVSPKIWNIGGASWRAYPMIRKAVFPMRAGKVAIGPARARVAVRRVSFDFFDSPFGDAPPTERASPSIWVTCRPKPGASDLPVGAFTLRDSLDRTRVPAGGTFSVTAQLSGDGRVTELSAPTLAIEGARVSEPESRLTIKRGPARLSSVKTWQWVVTAERPGTLVIPALSVPVLDPVAGRVVTVASAPMGAVVEPAPAAPPPAISPPPSAAPKPAAIPSRAVAGAAGAGAALLALGFWLGRRRAPRTALSSPPPLPAEDHVDRLLDALQSAAIARGGEGAAEVAAWRRRLQEIRFAPVFSSRDDAMRALEDEICESAAKWGFRGQA